MGAGSGAAAAGSETVVVVAVVEAGAAASGEVAGTAAAAASGEAAASAAAAAVASASAALGDSAMGSGPAVGLVAEAAPLSTGFMAKRSSSGAMDTLPSDGAKGSFFKMGWGGRRERGRGEEMDGLGLG